MSSTYAIIIGVPPFPSSSNWLFCSLLFARSMSSVWICRRMCVRTIPANSGESGHPCVNPSVTVNSCQVLDSSLNLAVWKS